MKLPSLYVCGMESEAKICDPLGHVVISAGSRPQLTRSLQGFNSSNVSEVVSFGVAGALAPQLVPGNLILYPDAIYDGLVSSAADKLKAYQSGKLIADMETATAAKFAQYQGLPLRVVRAVADPASFTLPLAACIPLLTDGTPNIWAILCSIASHPSQVPDLIKVYGYTNTAYAALRAWAKKERGS